MNFRCLFSLSKMTLLQKVVFVLALFVFLSAFTVGFCSDLAGTGILCFPFAFVLYLPLFAWAFFKGAEHMPGLVGKYLTEPQQQTSKWPLKAFIGLTILYCALISVAGFHSPDTLWQWNQVLSFKFDDWHPVTHTFLIWLITCICRRYWFFLFVQAAFYAFLVCSLWHVLKNKCAARSSAALITALITAFAPAVLLHLCVGWKDTAMMVVFFSISIMQIHLSASNGRWLSSPYHMCMLSIAAAIGTLLRHNAFFFTIPLMLLLPLISERKYYKHCFLTLIIFLLIYAPIKFAVIPHYCKTNENPKINQLFVEAVGVPLTIMGHVYCTVEPNMLEPEFVLLMQTLAAKDDWAKYHPGGGINSVKHASKANELSPKISLAAPFGLLMQTLAAKAGWAKSPPGDGINSVKHASETHEFSKKLSLVAPKDFFAIFIRVLKRHPLASLEALYYNDLWPWQPMRWPGFWVWLLIFFGAAAFLLIKWRVLPFIVPTVSYHVLTNMLLYAGDYRFFAYTVSTTLPMIWCIFIVCRSKSLTK